MGFKMTNILPPAGWPNVRQLETNEFASGGANGNMNEQAKSLAARSELLKRYAALPYESKTGGYALNERVQLATGDIVRSAIPSNVNNPNVDMTGWAFSDAFIANTLEDLRNRKADIGQVFFVKQHSVLSGKGGGNFIATNDDASLDDDGIIIVNNDGIRLKRVFSGNIQSDWFGVVADATSGAAGTDCVAGFQKVIDAGYKYGLNVDFNPGKYRCISLTYISAGYVSEWHFFRLRPNVKINIDKQCTLIAADGTVASNASEQGTKGFIFFSDAKTDCPNAEVTGGGTLDHNGQNNLLQPTNGWGNQSTTPTFVLSANSHGSKFHHLFIKNNSGHNHLINEKSEDVLFHHNTLFNFADTIAGNVNCADHSAVYSRGKRCKAFNNIVINNTHSYVTCAFEMHADGCEAYNNFVKNVAVLGLGASYTEADVRNTVVFKNNVGEGQVSAFAVDVSGNCELILHINGNIVEISGIANNPADVYGRVGHDFVTMRLPNNSLQPRNLEIIDTGNTITWETPIAWTPSDYGNCAARVVRKVAKWISSGNTFIGLQGQAAYFGASSIGSGNSQNAEISFSDKLINCGLPAITAYAFTNDGLTDYLSLPKRLVINDEYEGCSWGSIYANESQIAGITFAPQRFELNIKSDNYHIIKTGFNAPDTTSCEYNIEMTYLSNPSNYVALPSDNAISGEIRMKSPKSNEFMRFRKFSGVARWKMNRLWFDETLPSAKVNPFGDKIGDELELFIFSPTGATKLVCVSDGVGDAVGTWKKAGQIYT